MCVYIFQNNEFIEEIFLINHSQEDYEDIAKEIMDKYGKHSTIYMSDKRYRNPNLILEYAS